jgi:membrane protein required for colicin V production
MQTYDLLMLLVLVATTMFGFWKGFAWQVASLTSLVASYFIALKFSPQLAPMFGDSAPFNKFVAMLAIYIGSSFVIWALFRVVSGAIDKVKLNAFDHQIGALMGFAKGVLFCVGITFFAMTLMPPDKKEAIVQSRAGRYIVVLLDKTESIVPPEIHQVIGPYLQKIEERIDGTQQPANSGPQIPLWPGSSAGAGTAWPTTTQNPWAGQPTAWPQPAPQPAPIQPGTPAQPVSGGRY